MRLIKGASVDLSGAGSSALMRGAFFGIRTFKRHRNRMIGSSDRANDGQRRDASDGQNPKDGNGRVDRHGV